MAVAFHNAGGLFIHSSFSAMDAFDNTLFASRILSLKIPGGNNHQFLLIEQFF